MRPRGYASKVTRRGQDTAVGCTLALPYQSRSIQPAMRRLVILKKLANYPRQNGLAKALRETGKIERTFFGLAWYQDFDLRRRVNAGLNKGEARNTLARVVFFNRLGELRDRSYEDQQGRASMLTPLTAAIGLWKAVYLERVVVAEPWSCGEGVPEEYLRHLWGLALKAS